MLRKLLFSVVGAFWSNKSPMAITTAMLLSIGFLVLQYNYKPYRSNTCNALQQSCLFALLGLYVADRNRPMRNMEQVFLDPRTKSSRVLEYFAILRVRRNKS